MLILPIISISYLNPNSCSPDQIPYPNRPNLKVLEKSNISSPTSSKAIPKIKRPTHYRIRKGRSHNHETNRIYLIVGVVLLPAWIIIMNLIQHIHMAIITILTVWLQILILIDYLLNIIHLILLTTIHPPKYLDYHK